PRWQELNLLQQGTSETGRSEEIEHGTLPVPLNGCGEPGLARRSDPVELRCLLQQCLEIGITRPASIRAGPYRRIILPRSRRLLGEKCVNHERLILARDGNAGPAQTVKESRRSDRIRTVGRQVRHEGISPSWPTGQQLDEILPDGRIVARAGQYGEK